MGKIMKSFFLKNPGGVFRKSVMWALLGVLASFIVIPGFHGGSNIRADDTLETSTTTTSSNETVTTSTTETSTTTIPVVGTLLFADPSSGPAPLTVTFTCITDLPVSFYSWDFEDDSPDETTTVGTITHTYTTPGTYIAFASLLNSRLFLIALASTIIEVSSNETTTTTRGFRCPLETLYEGNDYYLTTFRSLRDELLSENEEGRSYISVYYRHAPEVTALFSRHQELREKAITILSEMIPVAEDILEKKEPVIGEGSIQKVLVLIDTMLPLASPLLKKDLKKLKRNIQNGSLLESFRCNAAQK
jgi:hypothetical protein